MINCKKMDQQIPQTLAEMAPFQAETATAKMQQTATRVTKPSREKDAKKVEAGRRGQVQEKQNKNNCLQS